MPNKRKDRLQGLSFVVLCNTACTGMIGFPYSPSSKLNALWRFLFTTSRMTSGRA